MKVQEPATTPRKATRSASQSAGPPLPYLRRLPIGAEVVPGGGVHFRVWAPKAKRLSVQLSGPRRFTPEASQEYGLEPEPQGYFSGYVAQAAPGMLYKFKLGGGSFPDPASRFQPEGPHGPSEIIDPSQFAWTDASWQGVSRRGQVLYELHIGTFTSEGNWSAAREQLPELAALGITVVELMPLAEFPGRFGWGYDGVDLFAPTRLYGRPDEVRAFVDAAHGLGLGVILDVVYNHLGPDGNYLKHFSAGYFTERYRCEWGEAINFDGPHSGPVREFFLSNAAYWVQEFHLDGLRLDATQQIFDSSPNHILGALSRRVRQAAPGRSVFLVAENETQQARLAAPFEQDGYGLDALWNDDFHHSARVALTGRSEAYYGDYRGSAQELLSAIKWGFLYQGQWYAWQKKRRGSPSFRLNPEQFITFLENHDQVANSLRGLRLGALTSPGRLRAMTALLLLGPATPMLFQGQEFGASSPFLFFADHHPELAKQVAKGREAFLKQFETIACAECDPFLIGADAEQIFLRSKLNASERQRHRGIYQLHRDLLQLRRQDPVFSNPRPGGIEGAVLGPQAFALRFFGAQAEDRLLLVNLGLDLRLQPLPEPLLAPVAGGRWRLAWSSEAPRYGGCGTPAVEREGTWRILGQAAVVLASHI